MDKTTHQVRLQQWAEIIQAQLGSGQSKRDWCRENNVPEKQFFYWQRRVRKEIYEAQSEAIVPIGSGNGPRLVEVPISTVSRNTISEGFHPDAVIAVGNITVGIREGISEALLMSIGKMIHHAL